MVVVMLLVLILLQPWGQVVGRNLIEAVDLLTASTPKQRRLSRNRSAKLLPTCGEEGRHLPALHTQKNSTERQLIWSTSQGAWCIRDLTPYNAYVSKQSMLGVPYVRTSQRVWRVG
jgi:hypothetical protein